jgi:indole-3-acetate monooxygenase
MPTSNLTDVESTIESVLPIVREHRDDIHKSRRLPDRVVDALRESGINRMSLPVDLGGLETPAADAFKVFERISAVDGSTGWCAVIGSASNIFAGFLSEAGARVVFADPDQGSATMFAPLGRLEVEGEALHLTGRWPFVSNCLHSEWIGVCAMLRNGADVDPRPQLVFVRASDLTIEDTWDVVGLRGTGSHHVTADHVVVGPEQFCPFIGRPWPDAPLWRQPLFSVLLPLLAAVPLGIARGALDEIARPTRDGRAAVRRGQLASDPLAMADYAAADSRLRGARAGLLDSVKEAAQLAECAEPLNRQLLARIFLSHLHATETAVEVTAVAHRLGGGAAAYADSPLLRALNDVQAARQHFQFGHEHRVELGRVVAGLNVTYPPYIT